MVNGSTLNTNQKKTLIYRAYTATGDLSATQYLPPSQFKIGINNGTPNIDSTALDNTVPIADGTTNDDGSNTMTGSSGGDNSTNNTTTYKEGAGNTDDTAQNLIANNTNADKLWVINDLAAAGNNAVSTQYASAWLYIKDATTLAKFKTTGTSVQLRLGVGSMINYYYKSFTTANLVVGWNWLSDNTLVSTWNVYGTPGTLNDFAILITTNNATDTFVAGDVVYDLLRQWEATDLVKDLDNGYPSLDLTNLQATMRGEVSSVEANGFLINGHALFNEDTSPLMLSEDTFDEESKSNTDDFRFVAKDRVV